MGLEPLSWVSTGECGHWHTLVPRRMTSVQEGVRGASGMEKSVIGTKDGASLGLADQPTHLGLRSSP